MKKGIFELTIEEFARVLCDMEEVYHLNLKVYGNDEAEVDELIGTYEQLHDFFKGIMATNQDNQQIKDAVNYIEESLFDYSLQLSELDIYNYLEYKTDSFNKDKVRILLRELLKWKSELNEERVQIINEKIDEDWDDVPLKEDRMIDYEEAKIKIWGYSYDYNLSMAICMLRTKIELKNEPQQNITESSKSLPKGSDAGEAKTRSANNKRGRPTATFRDKMICDDADTMLSKLHDLIDGRKGRDVALIIRVCVKEGIMTTPTFQQVKNEFGNIGVASGYNKYASNNNAFTDEDIKGIVNRLKE